MTSEKDDQSPLLPRQPQTNEHEKAQILNQARRNLEIEETAERETGICPLCGSKTSPEYPFCLQCGRMADQDIRTVEEPQLLFPQTIYGMPAPINPPVAPMYGGPHINKQGSNKLVFWGVGFIVGLSLILIIGAIIFALLFVFQ